MKYFNVKYTPELQIHCFGDEHLPQDTKYLIQIFEKIPGSDEYGFYNSTTLKRFHFYTFFRSFVGDFKFTISYFDKDKGLIELETAYHSFSERSVVVDLVTDDYFEATTWLNSCFEFYTKHLPSNLTVRSNFTSKFRNLHKKYLISYEDLDANIAEIENHLQIQKFDPKSTGVERYGEYFIMQNVGTLLDGGWRITKSFKFPRDWNHISSEDFSRDILGLPPRTSYRGAYSDYDFYTKINQNINNFN